MPSELQSERCDTTLLLTLSDPASRNTLSPQACSAGIEAVNGADDDRDLRCIVLRGAGAHVCAGGHLQRLATVRQEGADAQMQSMAQFHGFIDALRSSPLPVIAAVEGWAAGGGCSLALACDLIVAAEDARFVMSYSRVGLSPDGGGSWHLARALPRALALQAFWLAEPMTARRWHELGLVVAVTDSGQALAHALSLAKQLATMAPNALASAKALVDAAPQATLREHLDSERDHFVRNLFHANGGEGVDAFLAKRPARFS
ncbi:MAG: enoyl-CoA hydratase [Rubrivivax sp.]|nr:enoyl-CoA hydratase [Rubrivivax sp.]